MMSRVWQVQDAKARFSELLQTSLVKGPQTVTKRGVEAAVLVPIEQWRRLQRINKPSLKEGYIWRANPTEQRQFHPGIPSLMAFIKGTGI